MAGRQARAVADVPEVSTGDVLQEAWGDQVAQAINGHVHGGIAGMAGEDAVSHPTLVNVGPDDHHPKLHAADHAPGGADPIPSAPSPKPPKVEVFTANGNFVKDPDAVGVMVEVVGGGGSGGGTANTGSGARAAGTGGGGGGYARKMFAATALAASEQVTVGNGGAAGAAGDVDGNVGGASSFGVGATLVTGNGGGRGVGSASFGAAANAEGGAGGSATGGDINSPGEDGAAMTINAGPVISAAGHGGGSRLGSGAQASFTAGNGQAGGAYGGGGAGASANASQPAYAGGAGAKGVVIVTTYY